MKKILLLPILLLMVFVSRAGSANADLFVINEEEVTAQISELDNLENYVTAHQGATLTDVIKATSEGSANFDVSMLNNFATTYAEGPVAGIPSFLWGCVLGPAGLLVVYLVSDQDKQETRKALYGCLANGAAWILYVVLVGSISFSA
jgi:hypothetical protein